MTETCLQLKMKKNYIKAWKISQILLLMYTTCCFALSAGFTIHTIHICMYQVKDHFPLTGFWVFLLLTPKCLHLLSPSLSIVCNCRIWINFSEQRRNHLCLHLSSVFLTRKYNFKGIISLRPTKNFKLIHYIQNRVIFMMLPHKYVVHLTANRHLESLEPGTAYIYSCTTI